MTDVIVRPVAATHRPGWSSSTDPVSVTGASPQWGDDSDDTYADLSGSAVLSAAFPAVPNAETWDSIVYVRCQAISGSPQVFWQIDRPSTAEVLRLYSAADFPAPAEVTTLAIPSNAGNGDPIPALIDNDAEVTVGTYNAAGTLRVFDAWIIVAGGGNRPSTIRRLQRGDQWAIGGVPRSVQNRSRQATLRRGTTFS